MKAQCRSNSILPAEGSSLHEPASGNEPEIIRPAQIELTLTVEVAHLCQPPVSVLAENDYAVQAHTAFEFVVFRFQ
jgi:hypothetical protein